MAIELTDMMLAALKPPAAGRLELKDTLVPGLMLRVTAHDQRTWSVRGRLPDGKRIRPTIGAYPAVSIREARRRALRLLGDMTDGVDPTAVKRVAARAKAEAKQAPLVGARFIEWQRAKAADWSPRYAAEVERVGNTAILPKIGRRSLTATTREDWVGLATAVRRNAPAKAAWIYDVSSSFLNYSEAAGWLTTNPLPRRGRGHLAPKVAARQRVLTDTELIKLWQASEHLRPKPRAFVRLLIMTGARESEVAGIAVTEVDLLAGRWTIPALRAKNRNPITLPLHPLVQAELRRIWPRERVGADFRLLGAVRGSGLQAPSKVKTTTDRHAAIEPWRWHDLRRTVRTGLARLGIDQTIAELALNHLSGRSALVRTYDVHDYAPEILNALTRWQSHVTHILGSPQEVSLDVVGAQA
jgi:integrase